MSCQKEPLGSGCPLEDAGSQEVNEVLVVKLKSWNKSNDRHQSWIRIRRKVEAKMPLLAKGEGKG